MLCAFRGTPWVYFADFAWSATHSATRVRHGDTSGVESPAYYVYVRGKLAGVDRLGYLRIRRLGVRISPGALPPTLRPDARALWLSDFPSSWESREKVRGQRGFLSISSTCAFRA